MGRRGSWKVMGPRLCSCLRRRKAESQGGANQGVAGPTAFAFGTLGLQGGCQEEQD